MKPLKAELQDDETLRELGRASVQIVHDIKNQLNGLKLYATFLRKRMEKAERPADELETIGKMIAGLERAASEMSVLVRLGRPVELNRRPHTDLAQMLTAACAGRSVQMEAGVYAGEFDPVLLSDALKTINEGARAAKNQAGEVEVYLRREESSGQTLAVFEWRGLQAATGEDNGLFDSFAGSEALQMALAARIIRAHNGEIEHAADTVRARLPLEK